MDERLVFHEQELRDWLFLSEWDTSTALQVLVGLHPQNFDELLPIIEEIRSHNKVAYIFEDEEDSFREQVFKWFKATFKIGKKDNNPERYSDPLIYPPFYSPAHKLICLKEDCEPDGLKLDICNEYLEKGYRVLRDELERYPQTHPELSEHY